MNIDLITNRLNAIKRTHLFYNSNEELAEKVGVPSLAKNNNFDKVGEDKRIAIYDNLDEEYKRLTGSSDVKLDNLMDEYEATSDFYVNNELAKQSFLSQKESIIEILKCIFITHTLPENRKLKKIMNIIYNPERDQFRLVNFNISIFILLLYKIIPTYNSKTGPIADINADYNSIKSIIRDYHDTFSVFEENLNVKFFEHSLKSGTISLNRLSLIILLDQVVYITDKDSKIDTYDLYRYYKIDGVWVDNINKNVFYEITMSIPGYDLIVCEIGFSEIKYTKYKMEIFLEEEKISMFTTHPRGRARYLQNLKLQQLDYSYHYIELDDYTYPTTIKIYDKERHPNYDFNINFLYRANEEQESLFYEKAKSLKQIDKFESYKSEYLPESRIFAITSDFIYIVPPEHDFLYKISRNKYIDDNILEINVDDLAGVAVIAQKGPYIGFEKIGLYIDISSKEKLIESEVEIVQFNDIK